MAAERMLCVFHPLLSIPGVSKGRSAPYNINNFWHIFSKYHYLRSLSYYSGFDLILSDSSGKNACFLNKILQEGWFPAVLSYQFSFQKLSSSEFSIILLGKELKFNCVIYQSNIYSLLLCSYSELYNGECIKSGLNQIIMWHLHSNFVFLLIKRNNNTSFTLDIETGERFVLLCMSDGKELLNYLLHMSRKLRHLKSHSVS